MQTLAKAIVVLLVTAALVFGVYVGARTLSDPEWFVYWRNRLNGDPRRYPPEFRDQWWGRWNAMLWDPDRVRDSSALRFQLRLLGAFLAVVSAILLSAFLVSAVTH